MRGMRVSHVCGTDEHHVLVSRSSRRPFRYAAHPPHLVSRSRCRRCRSPPAPTPQGINGEPSNLSETQERLRTEFIQALKENNKGAHFLFKLTQGMRGAILSLCLTLFSLSRSLARSPAPTPPSLVWLRVP